MESKRITTKFRILLVALFLFGASSSIAQTAKQLSKAITVFNKKGNQKGIDKLWSYMDKEYKKDRNPSLDAFETWVQMEFIKYQDNKGFWDAVMISVEQEDSTAEETDSLTASLMDSFKNFPKNYFIDVCRKSTIQSTSYTADIYLRSFLVDYDPDTAVSEKAKSYFEEGEEFFGKEDYELAELNYRKALNEDSTYYKALLYLGDTFWAREDYDSAIVYFIRAKNMHPSLLEPRKYIVDALMEQGLYYRAKKECLDAFTVYPGFDMKYRMQNILSVENKFMSYHRFNRFFYPNDIKNENQRDLRGVWYTYSSSKNKISKYCNQDGIIEPNSETEDIYLEVYSIRRMLKKHEDELPENLKFAYKMMEDGYLECYVFISLFHIDIYPQFKHYMSFEENRTKSLEFTEKYLIETLVN